MTYYSTDQIGGPPPARTGRRFALAGAVAAVLAVGGVAVAQAAESPAPSGSAAPSGAPAPSGSAAPEQRERTPHLAGTVVSASGTTITITDRQGFQRTIHTSPATTYADGLTATPAAGTVIVAEGTVDTDRTSLAATRIGKLPDRAEGRGPGGGPGGWPGGRHGHGPRGEDPDPPAGTPSPGTPSPGTPGSGTPTPGAPGSGTPSPGSGTPAPTSPSPSPTG